MRIRARMYVVPATGGAPRRLTSSIVSEIDPSWSPDGRRLVFCTEREIAPGPSRDVIAFVDIATGHATTIAGSDGMMSPRWSPDGRWIVAMSSDRLTFEMFE